VGKERVTESPAGKWTRPTDYVEALARRRTFRRAHRPKERTQPESPRFTLSTLPFLVLLVALGILSVAIILLAWPKPQPQQRRPQPVNEQGYAATGWLKEAQKEMH
jgi:hypothetical protein